MRTTPDLSKASILQVPKQAFWQIVKHKTVLTGPRLWGTEGEK